MYTLPISLSLPYKLYDKCRVADTLTKYRYDRIPYFHTASFVQFFQIKYLKNGDIESNIKKKILKLMSIISPICKKY